jgi:nitroreductase
MTFKELIHQRYSCRAYKPDPVEEDKLMLVLEAARLAPTAANRQPFHIIVIQIQGNEDDVQKMYRREWVLQPPILLCICGVESLAWVRRDGKSYLDADAAIVVDHMTLQAAELGLGTCWIAAFDRSAVRDFLQLPDGVEPLFLLTLGYPNDQAGPKTRKPLEQIVRYDHW